jgi:hypothetical protein
MISENHVAPDGSRWWRFRLPGSGQVEHYVPM